MKRLENRYSLLVVGEGYWRLGELYEKVGARIEGDVGVRLSAPEGTERNIEEVGQAEDLTVFAMATVG